MKGILSDNWTALIFEGRNKAYGAFQLRKTADENQLFGLAIANLVFVALLIIYQILSPKVDSDNGQDSAFVFKTNQDKLSEQEMKKPQKEALKIVAIDSEMDLKFINVVDDNEYEKLMAERLKPKLADISDGVMKYAIDPKTGERFLPEEAATYVGGMDSFYVSITKQIKFKSELGLPNYRYDNGDDEIDIEINTLIFVECTVTAAGKLDSVKLFKGAADPKFNDRVLEAFKNSREWKPAFHKGKAISQKLIIPFHFAYKQPLIKYYRF